MGTLTEDVLRGMEDPQTMRLRSIASLCDDYRWAALLEEVEARLCGGHDIGEAKIDSDDRQLAYKARNHIIFRAIMKELREFPRELNRHFKESD